MCSLGYELLELLLVEVSKYYAMIKIFRLENSRQCYSANNVSRESFTLKIMFIFKSKFLKPTVWCKVLVATFFEIDTSDKPNKGKMIVDDRQDLSIMK